MTMKLDHDAYTLNLHNRDAVATRKTRSEAPLYQSSRRVSLDLEMDRAESSSVGPKENSMNRAVVDHTYTDHLCDTPRGPLDITLADIARKSHAKGPRGSANEIFPVKLYQMLEWTEQQGLESIVGWQPHGRCFLVRDKQKFLSEIMPRFFQQSKMSSFQRQLNLYQFRRLTVGLDQGSYYSPLFLRTREFLCERMTRTRVKGKGRKPLPSPETEPDFYKMVFCPRLEISDKKRVSSASRKSYPAPASPASQLVITSAVPTNDVEAPLSQNRSPNSLVVSFSSCGARIRPKQRAESSDWRPRLL